MYHLKFDNKDLHKEYRKIAKQDNNKYRIDSDNEKKALERFLMLSPIVIL